MHTWTLTYRGRGGVYKVSTSSLAAYKVMAVVMAVEPPKLGFTSAWEKELYGKVHVQVAVVAPRFRCLILSRNRFDLSPWGLLTSIFVLFWLRSLGKHVQPGANPWLEQTYPWNIVIYGVAKERRVFYYIGKQMENILLFFVLFI